MLEALSSRTQARRVTWTRQAQGVPRRRSCRRRVRRPPRRRVAQRGIAIGRSAGSLRDLPAAPWAGDAQPRPAGSHRQTWPAPAVSRTVAPATRERHAGPSHSLQPAPAEARRASSAPPASAGSRSSDDVGSNSHAPNLSLAQPEPGWVSGLQRVTTGSGPPRDTAAHGGMGALGAPATSGAVSFLCQRPGRGQVAVGGLWTDAEPVRRSVRHATRVRDEEVAGSNPVRPTTRRLTRGAMADRQPTHGPLNDYAPEPRCPNSPCAVPVHA